MTYMYVYYGLKMLQITRERLESHYEVSPGTLQAKTYKKGDVQPL